MESITHKRSEIFLTHVRELIGACEFQGWTFHVLQRGEEVYLQLAWEAPCGETGELNLQKSGKWFISRYATDSEIVQTALKAVLVAMEHEVRETFRFKGKPVFHPHYNVYALLSICDQKDARKEAV